MEKIAVTRINGEPIIGKIEQAEMLEKLNEIVKWINHVQPKLNIKEK